MHSSIISSSQSIVKVGYEKTWYYCIMSIAVISSLVSRNVARSGVTAFANSATFARGSLASHRPFRLVSCFSSISDSSSKKRKDRLFSEELNIIYDSKCNVCNLEINFLRKRDLKLAEKRSNNDNNSVPALPQPRLKFTDIEGSEYNPQDPANGGVTYETGMKSMHAVTASGKVVHGVPVFHMAYEQVNLGWLFAVTKIAWVKRIADFGYDVFAKYRTNITRGQKVDALVQAYQEKKALEKQEGKELEDCEACAEKATN